MIVALLQEYKDLIDQNVPLDNSWDEEINNISHVRQLIHENNDNIDQAELSKLDQKWQAHIISSKASDFQFSYPRESMPKSNWWAWVDVLDQLSEKELATL